VTRYRLGQEYGRGGLGCVLAGHDRKLDRTVAVKMLLRTGVEAEARFLREARITARLQHPSIVPIYDVGTQPNGEPYYVMKLIEGRTLKELIESADNFGNRIALVPHVAAVANAVGYAHSRGVIHRDLKPSNVIIGEHGVQYCIDWGLAKETNRDDDDMSHDVAEPYRILAESDLTVAGAVLGTPAYMPPEQARGEAVDPRADVYALGAILYHVLTGSPPHNGSNHQLVLELVRTVAPAHILEREPRVPRDLAAIVSKAMHARPTDRYATAAELAADLQRFHAGLLVGAHEYSFRDRARRWFRHNQRPTAVASVALVILVAVLFLSFRRITHERDIARQAHATAEARADELALQRAESLLSSDPTASFEAIHAYLPSGLHPNRAQRIGADAVSRGVAAATLRGHEHAVRRAWHVNESVALSVSNDQSLRRWNLRSGAGHVIFHDIASTGLVDVSADGGLAVFHDPAGTIYIHNGAHGTTKVVGSMRAAIWALQISGNGETVAASSNDARVRVFQLASRKVFDLPHPTGMFHASSAEFVGHRWLR
jgi:hypothetical protein